MERNIKEENIYTSVACNRTPDSVDWGQNGLIVFAANNAVVIMDPQLHGSCKIIYTYVQHTKRVSTVKWIKTPDKEYENEIISGSDDGTAIIWNIDKPYSPKHKILQEHNSGVNLVESLYDINKNLTVATGSTDSTIKLWNFNENTQNFEAFQTIILQIGYCLALKMIKLPLTNHILLSYAGDDGNIHLYTEFKYNNGKKTFNHLHTLEGHTDWVRSIDYVQIDENTLLLASGAQDSFIRLWNISNKQDDHDDQKQDIEMEEINLEIQLTENGENYRLSLSLESVLQGHDGWVYGVHWNRNENHLQLLSSSIDKTIIIWAQNDEGIWLEKIRLGEVGGNSLGFFGAKFSSNGKSIIGHGYQGNLYIWSESELKEFEWEPKVVAGGHFDSVRDICWEPYGQFLYSVSCDQTTRIHGPWNKSSEFDQITWHEIARPQVHGYNMQSIAVLSRYKFASGAEEKIIRAFHATANFVENFRRICHIENDPEGNEILGRLPKGASVPSLGLSNKAVYNIENDEEIRKKHVKDKYPENYFVPITLTSPPQEGTLMQNTLWPEIQKLYGHGFDIYALCASSDGKLLASSCIAKSFQHAQIIIWNTSSWKQIQKLAHHDLTVTQMKFSPNNQYLLSVSRDRSWALFENKSRTDNAANFQIVAELNENDIKIIHARVIWSCDWSHDSRLFGTASRDGRAVLWHRADDGDSNSNLQNWKLLTFVEWNRKPITAIAFAPFYIADPDGNENGYLLALGFEEGAVVLCTLINNQWCDIEFLGEQYAHHSTVRKLQFRPCTTDIVLASCGEDNFVRINKITFANPRNRALQSRSEVTVRVDYLKKT